MKIDFGDFVILGDCSGTQGRPEKDKKLFSFNGW